MVEARDFQSTPLRLEWIDTVRGISILWIALFHALIAYDHGRFPWPLGLSNFAEYWHSCPSGVWGGVWCSLEGLVIAVLQRGAQAVGVFILLSGFGLTYSLTRTWQTDDGWLAWYRKRLFRLFPFYWLAHLIVLVSPIVYERYPIDHRFLLSFLGDRVFPAESMFYYLVPAWWYFGLLLELCLVFPVLFEGLRRLGPERFLAVCAVVTFSSRYVLNDVFQAHGAYIQGAFFGARLLEFAAGMVLAVWFRRTPGLVQDRLFSLKGLMAGVAVYLLGVFSYRPGITYVLSDAFIGIGLFMMTAHLAKWMGRFRRPVRLLQITGMYSYGVYLLHQPFVMYCGRELIPAAVWVFLPTICGVLCLVCLVSIGLEKLVNHWVGRIESRLKSESGSMPSSSTSA